LKYILYILLIAVILGIIALIDRLLKKLFPSPKTGSANTVRQPRYAPIVGLLFALLGLICLLWVPIGTETLLWIGGLIAFLIGAYVLVSFLRFGIFYDDDGFTYRTLTRAAKTYHYADITGQRSFVAKSGLNTTLYVDGDEIPLNGSMQGVTDFLRKAFYVWCRERGLDPDAMQTDPATLTYFPEP